MKRQTWFAIALVTLTIPGCKCSGGGGGGGGVAGSAASVADQTPAVVGETFQARSSQYQLTGQLNEFAAQSNTASSSQYTLQQGQQPPTVTKP